MINVNELRIGNWVQTGAHHQQWREYDYTDSIDIYKSEPVSLTDEIFERCGFTKLGAAYTYQGFAFFKLGDGYSGPLGVVITTLHQLQNYIFALTGTELNYQP